MEKPVYIHYSAKRFDLGKGFPIPNRENWTKPEGGLWASRETVSFSWKDWCEREIFRVCNASVAFQFVVGDGATEAKPAFGLLRLFYPGGIFDETWEPLPIAMSRPSTWNGLLWIGRIVGKNFWRPTAVF